MKRSNRTSTSRYAAKLLFQFRVMVDGKPNKKRTCEERVIVLTARTADEALRKAKVYGKAERHTYNNNYGNPVHFELVGILDLLHLGPECEDGEVWYDITERLKPMERRKKIIPPEHKLNAIAWMLRATQQGAPGRRPRLASARLGRT